MSERIQLLEDIGAQFARVAAEVEAGSRPSELSRRPVGAGSLARVFVVAACVAAMLGGTAYAVPATREALDGVVGSLSGWVQGDDENPPGRAVEAGDNAPSWFKERPGDSRVIAETDGVGLFVRRADSDGVPALQFGIGPGLVVAGTLESWRRRLGERAVVVLHGPAAFGPRDLLDDRGHAPLLGVTTRDIARVELRYAQGPPLRSDNGDGGFVLMVDAWRPVRELVAYDAAGQVRERIDLASYDLAYLCEREPGCPSEATSHQP
ncbi:MAG: hypothetical protein ACJ76L_10485 [Conexibacter sp.]